MNKLPVIMTPAPPSFRQRLAFLGHALKATFGLTDVGAWQRALGTGGPPGLRVVSDKRALSLPAVWSALHIHTGSQSTLPFGLYRKTSAGPVLEDQHPVHNLFADSPNADQTPVDYISLGVIAQELKGNEYSYINRRADGTPIALTPMDPDQTYAFRTDSGEIRYRGLDRGKWEELPAEKVFHIRGWGGGPLGGLSTLAYARQTLGIAVDTEESARRMFMNQLRPSGVLAMKDFLKPEQRRLARENLIEDLAGQNEGKPLLLEGGATWTTITINPIDAQMLESREYSGEDIFRFFGVPGWLGGYGDKDSNWGTGLEQKLIAYLQFSLLERLKRREQAVRKQLLRPEERIDRYCKHNVEGLLRADSAARQSFYVAMVTNGIMTRNEVRALEERAPLPGGDVLTVQGQNVPLESIGQAPPPEEPPVEAARSAVALALKAIDTVSRINRA